MNCLAVPTGSDRREDPTMRLATALMEQLKAEGVEILSCYPTTPFIDTAARIGIRPIVCRQERVGVGIADGYSRLTLGNPPGVFAMQYGPGAENAFSGISSAYADSVPILLLPLGYPADRSGVTPYFRSAETFEHVTKAFYRLQSADLLRDTMRRVLGRLRNGQPGPVMLEVPHDLPLVTVPEAEAAPQSVRRTVPGPDPAAIEEAARLLRAAERPVILAGQGVLYGQASAELLSLAEHLAIPVVTTLAGKSSFPERHPLALGTAASSSTATAVHFLDHADVVLALGTSLKKHLMTRTLSGSPTLIQVTVNPGDLYADYEIACPVLGDVRQAIVALQQALDGDSASEARTDAVTSGIAEVRSAWMREWEPVLTSDSTPISPYRFIREVDDFCAGVPRSVLTHDSGSTRDMMVPFVHTREPGGYLGWGKSHALGSGLGLIMGAKLARPDAVCVNVMGDAAFGMVGLDFETAVRNEIPIITVVLNNFIMAGEEEVMRVSHKRYGARTTGGDYADMARAMGGVGIRVDRPSDIRGALQEAHTATLDGRAVLLEVITSPEDPPFSHRALFE
ncbi:thiamine pyrophosphate-requiring protein [Nakamurella sp. YIM 132087]|uniref:Thiamine pyrophosphate-requiring protein n=2 Tax=Nakamurella alba TaxID=2665158 RepID=A0A7K1FIW3_9ACTN|nr:thiamine pyrophosphate-requiring protein [Nakamurella alba]